jgi:hypothetical protein
MGSRSPRSPDHGHLQVRQNPTGAVVDAQRAAQIQAVLAAYPQILVIEDDYIAAIGGGSTTYAG